MRKDQVTSYGVWSDRSHEFLDGPYDRTTMGRIRDDMIRDGVDDADRNQAITALTIEEMKAAGVPADDPRIRSLEEELTQ